MKKIFVIILCFVSSGYNILLANDLIIIKNETSIINISPHLLIYKDSTNTLSFVHILKKKFTKAKNEVPNLGISKNTYWIKIQIKNISAEEHFLLDLSLATLDNIDFYYLNDSASYSSVEAGERFPFYQRKYIDPDYIFDLNIPVNATRDFYLKVSSKEGIQLPIKIGKQQAIFNELKNKDILSGLYVGLMLAMILYNLFIFFSVRDKSYILYVVYIVFTLMTQVTLQGYPFEFLWPDSPLFVQNTIFIFPCLVSLAGIEFMRHFLMLKKYSRPLFLISNLLYLPYLMSMTLTYFDYYEMGYRIMEMGSMLVSVHMVVCSIVVMNKGYKPGLYFLFGWLTFLVGVVIYILKDFEVLPFNNFTRYTMQIGSAAETILLSFALAARINIYKKEKEDSQMKNLELVKENEKMVIEQNIMLESKVIERTAQLEESNKSLKEAEAQLVNAEKMASLGQLTAGISHEINNPINFVVSNVKPLKRDIADILLILTNYNEIKDETNLKEKLIKIEGIKEEVEFKYLTEEINLLLKGIEEGANRTSEIVKGLKNFSRTDEADLKKCDIHEGIDSTLTILNNKILAGKISVIKNYGKLPQIECFPGKLNQVFMNIFNNAVDAIDARKYSQKEGVINIVTTHTVSNIEISIKDNGIGIQKSNLNKIFEPFFTTKQVGMGTGLGLSIVYGIIKSHHGEIKITSEENEGAEFIIILPVEHINI